MPRRARRTHNPRIRHFGPERPQWRLPSSRAASIPSSLDPSIPQSLDPFPLLYTRPVSAPTDSPRKPDGAPRVHAHAEVHPTAHLHEGVEIGPGCRVGPRCVIGPRTVLRHGAVVWSNTTLGADNLLHPFAVLGGDPQDKAFDEARPGRAVVGDRNIFREYSNVSRATIPKDADPDAIPPTRIGNGNFFMVGAHVGHNVVVGDNCVLVNYASLGGHASLGDGVVMSAHASVHQFCRVGDMVMFQGNAGLSMHAPPFVMLRAPNNIIAGLNRVGLRRNPSITHEDRLQVREAFRIMYRSTGARPLLDRIAECEAMPLGPTATKFVKAFRDSLDDKPPRRRGVVGPPRGRARVAEAEPAEL